MRRSSWKFGYPAEKVLEGALVQYNLTVDRAEALRDHIEAAEDSKIPENRVHRADMLQQFNEAVEMAKDYRNYIDALRNESGQWLDLDMDDLIYFGLVGEGCKEKK